MSRQPTYTDCTNCGGCDHTDYACPCGCHDQAVVQETAREAYERYALAREAHELAGTVELGDAVDFAESIWKAALSGLEWSQVWEIVVSVEAEITALFGEVG
jgi:hypothetical protein